MGTKANHTTGERRTTPKSQSSSHAQTSHSSAQSAREPKDLMAEAAEEVAVSASGRAETEREHRASPAKDTLSGKVRDQYADSKATLLDIKESATDELQAGVEKAKDAASEAADKVVSAAQDTGRAASEATASFVSTLKQNPLATALLGLGGIGVAMLVSNSRSAQAPTRPQRPTRAAASTTHNGRRSHARNGANGDQRLAADDESEGFVGQAVRQVRDGASAAASSAQKAVGSVGEQASALAQRAQTSLGEAGQAASQSVERLMDEASAQVQRLSRRDRHRARNRTAHPGDQARKPVARSGPRPTRGQGARARPRCARQGGSGCPGCHGQGRFSRIRDLSTIGIPVVGRCCWCSSATRSTRIRARPAAQRGVNWERCRPRAPRSGARCSSRAAA
jgi:hypothetical protein